MRHALDAINLSLPFPLEEAGERAEPWPHVDQSPNRRFKHCIQGLINLVSSATLYRPQTTPPPPPPPPPAPPPTPVLAPPTAPPPRTAVWPSSSAQFNLYNEFFETHHHQMPSGGWDWRDSFHYTEDHMRRFYDLRQGLQVVQSMCRAGRRHPLGQSVCPLWRVPLPPPPRPRPAPRIVRPTQDHLAELM